MLSQLIISSEKSPHSSEFQIDDTNK